MKTSDDETHGNGLTISGKGFASNALPNIKQPDRRVCSPVGVSTRNVPDRNQRNTPHWYALRTTYGREKKAYEYIISKGGTAFYPTIVEEKVIGGKRKSVETSRLPNIFFAYGTEEEIQTFVYDNVNLPYLRFYYTHHRDGNRVIKRPLVVPEQQMESLRIICAVEATDVIILSGSVAKFEEGQPVRIIGGTFAGVEGCVARFYGQQRVGVVINGLLTVATAYVPSGFLEKI